MRKQIQRLLDSDLSSLHIAKQSDVEQSTVYRLRSGERQLGKLGLDNAEKLYKFANEIFVEEETREQLLVNRASIMGMLNYMEMTDEESQKLNEEKLEIENKLMELNRMNNTQFEEFVVENGYELENIDENIERENNDFHIKELVVLYNDDKKMYAVAEYEVIDFKQKTDDVMDDLYEYQTTTTFDKTYTTFDSESEARKLMNK